MTDGQYKFSIEIDTKPLETGVQRTKKTLDKLAKDASKTGAEIDEALRKPFENLPNTPVELPPVAPDEDSLKQATAQFNGLSMSMQQIVREAPAMAMGVNTFVMAVSNNIPILADNIKRVRQENQALAASGKPTVSVFRQIVKSLFSWQTALIAVITTFAMKGKDILNWFTGAKEAADEFVESTIDLSREVGKLERAMADTAAEANYLATRLQMTNLSEKERYEALTRLTEIAPEVVDGIDAEAMSLDRLRVNLAEYNAEQEKRIRLERYKDELSKAATKKIDAELTLEKERDTARKLIEEFRKTGMQYSIAYNNSFLYEDDDQAGGVGSSVYPGEKIEERLRKYVQSAYEKYKIDNDPEAFYTALLNAEEEVTRQINDELRQQYPTLTQGISLDVFDFHDILEVGTSKRLEEASKAVDQATREYNNTVAFIEKQMSNIPQEEQDDVETHAEVMEAAHQEYIKAKEAFDKATANPESVTEDEFNHIKAVFELKKKAYLDAGGIIDEDAGKKAEKEAQRIEKETKAAAERAAKLGVELQRDADDAVVAAMSDGLDKELAQIKLGYKQRLAEINRQEEELRAARGGYLTATDIAALDKLRNAADATLRNQLDEAWADFGTDFLTKAEQTSDALADIMTEDIDKIYADWNDYYRRFGSLSEKYAATKSKYEREIAEAETEGARKALEAERDIVLAQMDVEMSSFAQDIVGKTTTELNAMVDELMAQMEAAQAALNAMDSTTGDDAAQYRKTIATLEAQIEALKEQLGKAKEEVKDDNWADATQTFQNISRAASDAASGIEEFDEGLANTFQNIAQLSGAAINMIGSIQGVMKAFAVGMSTIEKASAILAIIGAAIQAFSLLMTLFKGSDEVEQTMRQFEELNAELERFRKLAQIDSIEGTIFGKDAFGNLSNNLRVMREALDELNESKNKIRDYRLDYWAENVWGGAYASGAKYDSYEEALANMYVKTRDRSDFEEFFGATDEYAKLADLYPELFAGGEVSLEGLKKLRDSDVWEKLSQQNRDLIDELIADWERYEDATTAVTDYLTDVFGELGQEINNAIVDAWKNGTDAAVAFGDVAGKVLENLISQIGYTAYIAPILSQAMADVENLNTQDMTPEEYLNALMGIVGSAMTKAEAGLEDYNEYLDRVDRMAEEQGINAFNGERTAATKGIAQASQDSVDELNGRATAIQSHTSSIMESTKQLTHDTAEMLSRLAGIESNTAELKQMRLDMSAMRRDINDMATRGIVTR